MMGKKSVFILTLCILLAVNTSQAKKEKKHKKIPNEDFHAQAVAYISASSANHNTGIPLTGNVTFTHNPPHRSIRITGMLEGLPEGTYGFHIHEKGDILNGDCMRTGSHYNPTMNHHGAPTDEERHFGDLGNIIFNQYHVAEIDFYDDKVTLNGPYSVIGRSVVVHERKDDLGVGGKPDSLTTGHAGGRLACGVIGIS